MSLHPSTGAQVWPNMPSAAASSCTQPSLHTLFETWGQFISACTFFRFPSLYSDMWACRSHVSITQTLVKGTNLHKWSPHDAFAHNSTFFTIALVCSPSPRSPRADKWTVSQTKSDMNSEYIFTQKTSHGCETHTAVPHGSTKEHTDWQKTATQLSWGSLKSCLFFWLKHVVVTGCYLRTQDMKGGLFWHELTKLSAQMKLLVEPLSFSRALKNTNECPKWGIVDGVIRAPVGGQAGGGKSANCTPEGWAGPERGQPDEIEADDPITPD